MRAVSAGAFASLCGGRAYGVDFPPLLSHSALPASRDGAAAYGYAGGRGTKDVIQVGAFTAGTVII